MATEIRVPIVTDQVADAVTDVALEKTARYEVLAQLNEDYRHYDEAELLDLHDYAHRPV